MADRSIGLDLDIVLQKFGARGGPAPRLPVLEALSTSARVFNTRRGGVAAYPRVAGGEGGGADGVRSQAPVARSWTCGPQYYYVHPGWETDREKTT